MTEERVAAPSPYMSETDATQPRTLRLDDPAVVLKDVSMTYRVREEADKPWWKKPKVIEVEALKTINLAFSHGESIGIVGRNGSGKSTLTKLIAGSVLPTSGQVRASSVPVLLGVNAALVQQLSGRQNVILGCRAMGLSESRIKENYSKIVELAGLEGFMDLPMRTYSSGMSARLRFAIAAAAEPEILIVDEALNTGDAQFRERTRKRMDGLRENAGCVFLISHSMSTIREMTNRAIWIDKGELVMDGDPEEVTVAYRRYTWLLGKEGRQQDAADHRDSFKNRLRPVTIEEVNTRR
ncbi:teichoic acid transport system ATP-binding protein [Zhihengliuella halotolerans]|uniref:Teichoic acid transport system ATP-binding protein n=2 Tax=Zhihengliuella halotolerans TaxID=370736 RepID=A0A4Q8AD42_9MICC|nr:teichoic acid transport system ATP-binding protein [Zhihengliuella halotolerans]